MKRILTSLILLLALAIAPRAFGQQLVEHAKFQGPADGQTFVTVDANHIVSFWINHCGWRCRTPEVQVESMNKTARLKGMKDAVADIEKGTLKLKFIPRVRSGVEWQMPDHEGAYMALVTQECGVAWVTVESSDLSELGPEMVGYNAVMSMEIEHRFGPDIFRRLREKAYAQPSKN